MRRFIWKDCILDFIKSYRLWTTCFCNKFAYYSDFLKELENSKSDIIKYDFYENIISTNSNLNYETLCEILDDIGFEGERSAFLLDKALIDESLLGTRNGIAHGEIHSTYEPKMDVQEYCQLHDRICRLLDLFQNGVLDMVQNKSYLAFQN